MNPSHKTRRQFLTITAATAGSAFAQKGSTADAPVSKYVSLKKETLDFYTACREAFAAKNADEKVAEVCKSYGREILGGPLLGDISTTGVSVWMHLPQPTKIKIVVDHTSLTSSESERAARCSSLATPPSMVAKKNTP